MHFVLIGLLVVIAVLAILGAGVWLGRKYWAKVLTDEQAVSAGLRADLLRVSNAKDAIVNRVKGDLTAAGTDVKKVLPWLMLVLGIAFMSGCGPAPVYAQAGLVLAPIEVHYSPAENLETLDLAVLDSAAKSVDVSTYALDDRPIAAELVKLAGRGVAIRIYRDQTQYEGEVARGQKRPGSNLQELFARQPNIHVRVKGAMVLAHLKAYAVDGKLLREGSANWSTSGLKSQDNSLILISDPVAVATFERNFEQIWDRPGNRVVQ